jgi:hypothetical protein
VGQRLPPSRGTWPYKRAWLRHTFWDIPVKETRQILGLAAAEMYDFGLRALAVLSERIGPTPADLGQDDAVSVPKWEAARRAGRHRLTGVDALPDLVENWGL